MKTEKIMTEEVLAEVVMAADDRTEDIIKEKAMTQKIITEEDMSEDIITEEILEIAADESEFYNSNTNSSENEKDAIFSKVFK